MTKWYEDPKLVAGLGNALINAEIIEEGIEFSEFLLKPFKYNAVYNAWEQYDFPDNDEDKGWDEFVEALSDEEEEEDDEE